MASLILPYLADEFDLTLGLLEDRWDYRRPEEISVVAFSGKLSGNAAHITYIPWHVTRLITLVRKSKARAVLSFMEEANIINLTASRFTGHNAVISQHGDPRRQYTVKGILGRLIGKASAMLYPSARGVICVSSGISKILAKDYHIPRGRLKVIHNPVNMDELLLQGKEPPPVNLPKRFILHVGRLKIIYKGQDLLLTAFAGLHESFPDIGLVFVGDGKDRELLQKQAERLGVDNNILFAGWRENVASFMARAEVFVLPSRYEGWPIALMEAMACGCPVIASDCSTGPGEILAGGDFGRLIPVENVEALVSALSELLTDPGLRNRMSHLSQRRAREFDVSISAPSYADYLKEIIRSSICEE